MNQSEHMELGMNNLSKLALVFFLSFAMFGNASATDWQVIGINSESASVFTYDIDSVRNKNSSILVWSAVINSDKKEPHDMYQALFEIECDSLRSRILIVTTFLRGNRKKTMDFSNNKKWSYPPPGTLIETMSTMACSRERSKEHFQVSDPLELTLLGKKALEQFRKYEENKSKF